MFFTAAMSLHTSFECEILEVILSQLARMRLVGARTWLLPAFGLPSALAIRD
jgi:hypothetical protein